jgi:endonuclease/exonuclease/phosphatase family metal-dependent hydrolase
LSQGFLEPLGQRIAAGLLRLHRLLEDGLAARRLSREDALGIRQLRPIRARRLAVLYHTAQIGVDDENGLATGARHFKFRFQPRHAPIIVPGTANHNDCVSTIRIATYNIHRCRGLDGRTRPERIAEVLAAIDADVVALQEVVGAGPRHGGQAEYLGAALGMGCVMAPVRQFRGHAYGNVVLSRFPMHQHAQYDLSWKTCEPRGCQRVDIDMHGTMLHLYNVHLGTAILERRFQAQRLATVVGDRRVAGPKLVLGDFNEWMRGVVDELIGARLKSIDLAGWLRRRRRTYPGVLPLVHLDHIYYQGAVEIIGVQLWRTRRSLIASDHLPLVAEVKLGT